MYFVQISTSLLEKPDRVELTIHNLDYSDVGNYTCHSATYNINASVLVVVEPPVSHEIGIKQGKYDHLYDVNLHFCAIF